MFGLLLVFFLLGLFLFWVINYISWGLTISPLGLVFSNYFFDFLVDDISVLCLVMLMFCGSIALFFCDHYFGGEESVFQLYSLMVWFLMVMGVLVLSGSLLFSLILWEYLGLVSFFLILFYSNMSSLRASLITLFASRFGDVALFFLVGWLLSWLDISCFLSVFLLMLVVMTKSACYPFISWLLEAMRAPTPVSSLVHSSTLVAAGIWFFFRYSSIFSDGAACFIFLFAVTTIIISAVCALCFNDLKKLVALSTCNNVSWCLIFFICGDLELALLQLLTHGVCKCYLFMSIGDLMGQSGGSQSSVGVFLSRYSGGFMIFLQGLLIISLCGLPFLGVFFSKHNLFSEAVYIFGFGFVFLLVLGVFLSYCYSFRFVLLLLKGLGGLSLGYVSEFMMISFISFLGTLLNLFGGSNLDESVGLFSFWSWALLLVQLSGCVCGWYFFSLKRDWVSLGGASLLMSDSIVKGLYSVYLGGTSISLLSFYRWEFYLINMFPIVSKDFLAFRPLFSFNVLIFFVCLVSFVYFFVGV